MSEKTGISEAQAKQAVGTAAVDTARDNLPEPIADQVEGALSGVGGVDVGGLAQVLGDLLGKK